MEALRQHDVMAQPFPYEKEVALYDGDYSSTRQRVYYEPDEEFYDSLSAEEFTRQAIEMVKRVHAKYGKK